jgi:hypothetical protein
MVELQGKKSRGDKYMQVRNDNVHVCFIFPPLLFRAAALHLHRSSPALSTFLVL